LRCCCRRCELMGRKKPCAASGTCVLLAAVVGLLWGPRLPDALRPLCTPPSLRFSVRDQRFWLPECAVAIDEGREGGRPASPAGPVRPSTRLPLELRVWSGVVMAGVLQSQSPSLPTA
jgi:hypothetical protein